MATEGGHYKVLLRSSWEDEEPDTLTIEAAVGDDSNRAYVTFEASYTWVDPHTIVEEVIPFLRKCAERAQEHNLLVQLRTNDNID